MTVAAASPVYFDPFDNELKKSPHATYRRLRDESPLFYNGQHDFYLVSRYDDVQRLLNDRKSYISGKGMTIQLIKSGTETPPGLFVNEDAPVHTRHRSAVALLFNPGHIAEMETKIRDLCATTFEDLAGRDKFDLIAEVGAVIPTQVVGMLIGIPDKDRAKMREDVEAGLQAEYKEGDSSEYGLLALLAGVFNEYIDWREKHPADDDLMTQLMNVDFKDETGTERKLTRDELLMFLVMIASAGIDTTSMFTGWAGKTLSDHPDQRQILVDDPAVIPNAVEEILRYESPSTTSPVIRWCPPSFTGRPFPPTAPWWVCRVRPTATIVSSRIRRSLMCDARFRAHWPSAMVRTTASGLRWPDWRAASSSRRCSSASPPGRSTTRTQGSHPDS